ncbi:MAG: hypothetical protein ABI670_00020 [Chloroflexota bacterium]
MNNAVTIFMCALFLLLFVVVGYMVASGWVRTIFQQVRFGKDFYQQFKADKQKWEDQTRSQESAAQKGIEAGQLPASGSDQSETNAQK